ncbi:MAG: SDR family NAD(P)-dependent oxidoreductase, partial [Gemmataceae bacterium]|nr:SDR family NAD(P)-dependent oxidoreductase [Gemmataceae bacterium]
RVLYRSADIRDAEAVRRAVSEARALHGPVRGIVHGAGVLADARLEDKTAAQFDAVWGTKVQGLRSLLAACAEDDLRAVALFSSSTARFGRVAQSDYAMANEALNKLAWAIGRERPSCRAVALGWGPWDGGMVTPGLKALFAGEGVGVIPLAEGARLVCDELTHAAGPSETVVLAPVLPSPRHADAVPLAVAFERVATLDELPILRHHRLDGKPVVPFALMLEWLAHAALVQNPGFLFHGADDLRVLHGVVLDGAPMTLKVGAGKATRRDGLHVAAAEIRSAKGLHARADILLANNLPPAPEALPAPFLPPWPHAPEEAYRRRWLFHGPGLHAIEAVEGMGEAGAVARMKGAPPPVEWLRQPLRQKWLADPMVLDGCFQLAILWSRAQRGAASLPCRIRRYRQYRKSFPAEGTTALLSIEKAATALAAAGLQLTDSGGAVVAVAEGFEFAVDAALDRAFACRA